jgi:thymidylate synthase
MVIMETSKTFPMVEAILLLPEEGERGSVGICSNTTAPGQVLNELPESIRASVAVIGPLIVSRDGTERMIVNALAHPTLRFLVLFSEESTTFVPSTNLLLALMDGFDETKTGNYIQGGLAASAHYPSITKNIFTAFSEAVIVLPAYMPKHADGKAVIARYLDWVKPNVSAAVHECLVGLYGKDKIYYDSLKKLLTLLGDEPALAKRETQLDAKDFQHLQPPKIVLENSPVTFAVPFSIERKGSVIRAKIKLRDRTLAIESNDPFLLAYSLMVHLGDDKRLFSPRDQLLFGAELGRVSTEAVNDLNVDSFVRSMAIEGGEVVPIQTQTTLKMDTRYYYKVNAKQGKISVMCLAFDVCESVFELITEHPSVVIDRLVREGRFENYPMDILHRIDVGTQIGRAAIAAKLGYSFIQDFAAIFKINTSTLPSVTVESDTFLDVHKGVIRRIYTEGITEEHGDPWKGLARTASVLAIYRNANVALKEMPALYRQGDQDPVEVRAKYKEQLLRFDHDGTYSYGERTRSYFGFDQLMKTIEILKNDASRAALIQRFDPAKDMSTSIDPDTGKEKFTHDPCLTHDIYFTHGGKLHAFHIARAHNAVNAYPENVFGLFDAYDTTISEAIGIPIGDVMMFSNRANILLLTEEQRAKKILAEPSKPIGEVDPSIGPEIVGVGGTVSGTGGVAMAITDLKELHDRPSHPSLDALESYCGIDTVEKAIAYLVSKGSMHNNVTLSQYIPGTTDAQADQLAFLQMNVFGKKVYVTMVFMNHSIGARESDRAIADFIATRLCHRLGNEVSLGQLTYYSVAYSI